MKFSHFVADEFYLYIIYLVIHNLTGFAPGGFASTINTEFDIIFLVRFLAKSTL